MQSLFYFKLKLIFRVRDRRGKTGAKRGLEARARCKKKYFFLQTPDSYNGVKPAPALFS